jgi:PKD repeat protein
MQLERRDLLSGYHFDFGTSLSPVATGYTSVHATAYSPSSGRGWVSAAGVSPVDRGTASALTRDFHTGVDATFRVDMPNGTYRVTTMLGEPMARRGSVDVYLNGMMVASNISTEAGRFAKSTYTVQVTQGMLTIRLVDKPGVSTRWALDYLDVAPGNAPVVSAGRDRSADEGTPIAFSGTATGAGPLTYAWNFGDGSGAIGTLTPTHAYADNGSYTALLTVTDANGVSDQSPVSLTITNALPRPNALGPYTGVVAKPVHFVVVTKDSGLADVAAGFAYGWAFGDGGTATGPTPNHTYSSAGTYTATVTAKDKDGSSRSTTTTVTILATDPSPGARNDYQIESTNLIANRIYGSPCWDDMASDGAWSTNAQWEQGQTSDWYIEQQRYGESLIISGLLQSNTDAINAGFKAFDWGFAHQATDGSFAGTGDPFHSTALFVEAVAHACLFIQQSPVAQQYQSKVTGYVGKLQKAALWMSSPSVWSDGTSHDVTYYTHRQYLDADALALTSLLVGGDSTMTALAREQIQIGLAAQLSNGVNPEKGGYDSSYQTLGLSYAELWTTYFPTDSLTPAVKTMIDKGLAWEKTMILSTGEVSTVGNTRTGVETGRDGEAKTVDWKKAVTAFAYWYQVTGKSDWQTTAQKMAQYYYQPY